MFLTQSARVRIQNLIAEQALPQATRPAPAKPGEKFIDLQLDTRSAAPKLKEAESKRIAFVKLVFGMVTMDDTINVGLGAIGISVYPTPP